MFGPIDWQVTIDIIIVLLISIDVHELAHAVVADQLGDPTPRHMGEISLNPFVHMDQVGIILLIVTSISGFGFTYGRTHVTPTNLKYGTQRGNAIVAIVGPISNLVLAAISAATLRMYGSHVFDLSDSAIVFLKWALLLNVLLFVLNLLPIPPLDGFTVLGGFLSSRQMYSLAPLVQWGPIILLLLIFTNSQTHILSNIIDPPMSQVINVLCSNGCGSI